MHIVIETGHQAEEALRQPLPAAGKAFTPQPETLGAQHFNIHQNRSHRSYAIKHGQSHRSDPIIYGKYYHIDIRIGHDRSGSDRQ